MSRVTQVLHDTRSSTMLPRSRSISCCYWKEAFLKKVVGM